MALFYYKLLEDSGRITTGQAVLPFDEVAPAVRYLERQGGVVLSIHSLSRVTSAFAGLRAKLNPIKRSDVASLLANLATVQQGGCVTLCALDTLMPHVTHSLLLQVVRCLRSDIEGGQTLSLAMSRHPEVFSPVVVSLCRTGEEKDRLAGALRQASEHLQNMDALDRFTRRALISPAMLVFSVLAATCFWFVVVMPHLDGLFNDVHVSLPLITRGLFVISGFLRIWLPVILAAAIIAAALFCFLRRYVPPARKITDPLLLSLPVVRVAMNTSLKAQVSECLATLLATDTGVLRTLDIIGATLDNSVYQKRLLQVKENVRNGSSLADALEQGDVLHCFAVRLLDVGDQARRADAQTGQIARVYGERLSGLGDVLHKSLEPVMLLFLGVLFAMIIMGLLLPGYDLLFAN